MTLTGANATPGALTFNAAGSGQAVAANQDGAFNGPLSRVAKGSDISLAQRFAVHTECRQVGEDGVWQTEPSQEPLASGFAIF